MPDVTEEFCGCTVYDPGEECGMVVCWKCERIVGRTTDDGGVTVRAIQRERDEARAEAERLTQERDFWKDRYDTQHRTLHSAEDVIERLRKALTVTVAALSIEPGETHHDPACGVDACASCWALSTATTALSREDGWSAAGNDSGMPHTNTARDGDGDSPRTRSDQPPFHRTENPDA